MAKGIDLATPRRYDLGQEFDRAILDALLEGFDTGAQAWAWMWKPGNIGPYMYNMAEADSARNVVSMGHVFGNFKTPHGGFCLRPAIIYV